MVITVGDTDTLVVNVVDIVISDNDFNVFSVSKKGITNDVIVTTALVVIDPATQVVVLT